MAAKQVLVGIAIICEVLAMVGWPADTRINLIAAGLVFFLISVLVS